MVLTLQQFLSLKVVSHSSMGPGQNFLTGVRPGQFFVARVGSNQPSMVWVWKISPKCQIFQYFALRVKKISSGCVKKYPGQRRVGLLFTAGQK